MVVFYIILGLSLVPLLIILGVAYAKSRKIFPLMYILSVFAYINTITYAIDAFSLDKNWIIALLGLSAVFMTALGFYFSRLKKIK